MTNRQKVEARQTFNWIPVGELEMAPPQWGRPLRQGDIRSIAAFFDPDKLGAIAVWHRPNLPILNGRFVICDGQHRAAAVRLMGYDDQRVPCLIYEGLTMETAAELSLGLQERRNLHVLDKHRAALAAHDRRAVDVDKVLRFLGLEFAYRTSGEDREQLSAVSAVGQVWDRMGGTGLERVLSVCGEAWGKTAAGYSAKILKLVMTILAAHNGQVDDHRLVETLSARSPGQWIAAGVVKARSISSLAQDVIVEYNRKVRGGNRLQELTPSEYERAAKRMPSATVRGKIDVARTTGSRGKRGPGRYSNDKTGT